MTLATLTQARSLAPDFELPDQTGAPVSLHGLLGGGPVVLVFFRGHWCPYCRRYLSKLQGQKDRWSFAHATIVGISPEPSATSLALARELGLSFPLLSDVDGEVIGRYGTRNGFVGGRTLVPHPALFILDASGAIRFRSIDRNYKKRTTMRTIHGVLEELAHASES